MLLEESEALQLEDTGNLPGWRGASGLSMHGSGTPFRRHLPEKIVKHQLVKEANRYEH
jgi:hypothetical protein